MIKFEAHLNLKENITKVRTRIEEATIAAGREPNSVELIAVSKRKPADLIREAFNLGVRKFGENYVEELLEKAEELKNLDLKWAFIGQLQSNKIKRLMPHVSEIHTVASEKHLRYISEFLEEKDQRNFPVYLHVNSEAEKQKFGMAPEDALTLAVKILHLYPRISLMGIFAIPSEETSTLAATGMVPGVFKELQALAEKVGERKLSLGMSLDLESAIKAGSTCVRIGTDIFGMRER